MVLLYFAGGVNHFVHPEGYYSIIPDYIPKPVLVNAIAGMAEIFLAVLLLFEKTRKLAAVLIICMLVAFLPAHIFMIQKGGCMGERICVPLWVAWLRLPLQFVLIWWAWWAGKYKTHKALLT